MKGLSVTPCSYATRDGFDDFVVDNLTPLVYTSCSFTNLVPNIPFSPEDAKLFEHHLDLYWGERVKVGECDGERYVAVLAYGETRLERLMDKVSEYVMTGTFFQDKAMKNQSQSDKITSNSE
jgi:hypothetical protein